MNSKDFKYDDISIWLKKGEKKPLYCMICRTGLRLFVDGTPISIIPGDANADKSQNMAMPITVPCGSNSEKYGRCPARYIIQGIVE